MPERSAKLAIVWRNPISQPSHNFRVWKLERGRAATVYLISFREGNEEFELIRGRAA